MIKSCRAMLCKIVSESNSTERESMNFPTSEQVTEDISFTEATLDDSMVEQPSLVAHYGRLLAEAEYEVDLAKQQLEIAEGYKRKEY